MVAGMDVRKGASTAATTGAAAWRAIAGLTIAPAGTASGAGTMTGGRTAAMTGAAIAHAMATATGWAAIMRRADGAMATEASRQASS